MASIGDVIQQLADWLRGEIFTPPLRAVSLVELPYPAAYPNVRIILDEESYGPVEDEVTAALRLRVMHAAGRPAETQAALISLTHQLRRAIARSHGLGGSVLQLRCGAIRYGTPSLPPLERAQADAAGGELGAVVQSAEISLLLRYHESPRQYSGG